MKQPWVYMCSPSQSPLPPPSPPAPPRFSQCTRSERLSHLCPFLNSILFFFAVDWYAFLYILDINPLSNIQFANISPIGCKYFLLFCRLPLYYIL